MYTPRHIDRFIVEFLTKQGYSQVSQTCIDPEQDLYIFEKAGLIHITKVIKGDCKAEIVESVTDSAFDPIMRFYRTLVMNCITADFIMALHPRSSLERVPVIQENIVKGSLAWKTRYELRGYNTHYPDLVPLQHLAVVCPALVC